MPELRYPGIREDLKNAARDFADQAFQSEVWAAPTVEGLRGHWDFLEGFEYVVDDVGSGDNRDLIGVALVDERELTLFNELRDALRALTAISPGVVYADVADSPELREVRIAAGRLHSALEPRPSNLGDDTADA